MKRFGGDRLLIGLVIGLLSACSGERPLDLGKRDGMLAACPSSPNCVSSLAVDDRHRIAPLAFTGDPAAAFMRLFQVVKARKDAKVIEDHDGYLRVEFHTTFFTDDAEFLLYREKSEIQVRSASRLGYYDLGKNRRRMEEIRRSFAGESGLR